ncbi:hypothetical protein ACU686_05830 [Yinghuangia aomiensis]
MIRVEAVLISVFGALLGMGLGLLIGVLGVRGRRGRHRDDPGRAVGPDGAVPRSWPRWSACWPRPGPRGGRRRLEVLGAIRGGVTE